MQFSEALKEFSRWRNLKVKHSTVLGYEMHIRYFCLYMRNVEVGAVTLSHIVDYLTEMRELGWHDNSFEHRGIALKKFFEFCRRVEYSTIDPELIPILKRHQEIPRVSSDEIYRKIMAAIPAASPDPRHDRNKAIISLLRYTGIRNGELCSINIKDIDTVKRQGTIKTEKSKQPLPYRIIKWPEETNEYLKAWLVRRLRLQGVIKNCDAEALFIGVTNKAAGKRLGIGANTEMFRRYSHVIKLDFIANPHSWRHNFIHEALDVLPIHRVKAMTGHSNIDSLNPYIVLKDNEVQESWSTFTKVDK